MNRPDGLVPTRIVNKNGIATTVHKRGVPAGKENARVPAPVVTSQNMTIPQKVERLVQRIIDTGLVDGAETENAENKMYLFQHTTLDRLESAFASSKDVAGELAWLLVGEEEHEIINMAARFMPEMDTESLAETVPLLRGIQFYRELPYHSDYSEADSDVQRQVVSLLKVSAALERYHGKSFFEDPSGYPVFTRILEGNSSKCVKDENVVRLVLRRPQDADSMISILKEHGPVEPQVMEALLDGADPKFASGAL